MQSCSSADVMKKSRRLADEGQGRSQLEVFRMPRTSVFWRSALGALVACSQHAASPLPAEPQSVAPQPNVTFKSIYKLQASLRTAVARFGDLRLSNGTFYSNALNGGANGIGAVYKGSARPARKACSTVSPVPPPTADTRSQAWP